MVATADDTVMAGARRALERHGWRGATLERIAAEAGVSRMTLHRHGVTRERLLTALGRGLEEEYRAALWPALTAEGTGRARLERALDALCDVADANAELIAALDDAPRDAIFHEPGDAVLTKSVFTEPVERILRDGALDGSLRPVDPSETATVLFNLIGWTYRHLRRGHGWSPERARRELIGLALDGVGA
jgi:AcrR family transcriptional regulator